MFQTGLELIWTSLDLLFSGPVYL